jgi:glycosyltransferase involved in cell wall biosynthesis
MGRYSRDRNATADTPDGRIDILFVLFNFAGGGLEKKVLRLAAMLKDRGNTVAIAVCYPEGALGDRVAGGIEVIPLEKGPVWKARAAAVRADPGALGALLRPFLLPRKSPRMLPFLPSLARLLARRNPRSMFTAMPHMNVTAVLARRLAGADTRVVLSEINAVRDKLGSSREWMSRYVSPLMKRAYGRADAIIAVSDGVADDLADFTGLPRDRITTVYNPTVTPEILEKAGEPVDHPWFAPGGPPVILGVGRYHPNKDFPTLIRAFAKVRAGRPVRLVILGDAAPGKKRDKYLADIQALVAELGIGDDVDFPGFTINPYRYMSRAALFVLSSLREGFPNVLVEAMACGCPVVATDCPHGPPEILDNGTYGRIVPMRAVDAMAEAIARTLDAPISAERLKARASEFTAERAVERYERILLDGTPGRPQ